jgi:hypothetical protein
MLLLFQVSVTKTNKKEDWEANVINNNLATFPETFKTINHQHFFWPQQAVSVTLIQNSRFKEEKIWDITQFLPTVKSSR